MPVSVAHTILAGVDTDTSDARLAPSAARSLFNVALERGYATNAWGNEALAISLPEGRSKVVGSFPDADNGDEILFVWNSLNHHRLYRYVAATRASTLLLEWAGLNLRENHYVTGGGIIADQLGYLDADGVPRLLSLTRAAAGEYTSALLTADPHSLDLARRTPAFAPTLSRGFNGTAGDAQAALRLTHDHAWQAAYRLAYGDSELTPLSPYSEVLPSYREILAAPGITSVTNYVRIEIDGLEKLSALVAYIEVYVRKDDSPVWRLATTLRRPAGGGPLPRTIDFYGNTLGAGLSEAETVKQREAVPLRAEAMTAMKNRFVLANLTEGLPLPTRIGLVAEGLRLFASLTQEAQPTFLCNGIYTAGIQFYDWAGRTCGALTIPPVTMPARNYASSVKRFNRLDWSLPTTDPALLNQEIPAWAETWGLVLSKEQSKSFFIQFRAADALVFNNAYWDPATPQLNRLWLYGGSLSASVTAGPWASLTTSLFIDIGNLPDSTANRIGYTFKAGSGDRMRFVEEGIDVAIIGQQGAYLQVVWPRSTGPSTSLPLIEIYSPASSTEEDPLFENGPRYPVIRTTAPDGTEQRSYGVVSGQFVPDAFLLDRMASTIFQGIPSATLPFQGPVEPVSSSGDSTKYQLKPPTKKDYTNALRVQGDPKKWLQDALGYSDNLADQVLALYHNFTVGIRRNNGGHDATTTTEVPLYITVEAMNPNDANYAVWLHGRTRPTATRLPGQVHRAATLRFTGALVPGTRLNGLTTVDALNEKELAREQGAVVSLKIGDQTQAEGSVLVAVQQRGAESFYLGQVQLSQASGQPLLSISDQVLSPGNPLSGKFGTTHPESVAARNGVVWYWDELRREVVRYDRSGTTGLTTQHKYRTRCYELARRHAGASVVGYVDPARQEYVLTFGAVGSNVAAETIAFSTLADAFVDGYAFTPEWGCAAGAELLTFAGAVPHRHASELPRNTFYGIFSPSRVELVIGGESSEVEKTWTGVNQEASSVWLPTTLRNAAGQASTMLKAWFTRNRTTWQGSIRRDQNTPGMLRPRALHEGRKLQSPLLTLILTCDTAEPVTFQQVSLNYSQNAGLPIAPTR